MNTILWVAWQLAGAELGWEEHTVFALVPPPKSGGEVTCLGDNCLC